MKPLMIGRAQLCLNMPMVITGLPRTPFYRKRSYNIATQDGGVIGPGLIADLKRNRHALPDITPVQILAATPAEIGAAMRACTFVDWTEFARASVATDVIAGQLVSFAANQPRLSSANGLLLEGPAANKVTARKYNPVDTALITLGGDAAGTFTVVDDAAALAAAGLSGICTSGKVYKIDNSAGAGSTWVTLEGMTGNTNPHTLSVYVRGSTSGVAVLGLSGGASGGSNIDLQASYRRVTNTGTPVDTSRKLSITARPGQVVYFILPQLEEGPRATSVIPGDTLSAVARAADNCKLTARAAALLQRASAGALIQGDGAARISATPSQIIGGSGSARICGMTSSGAPTVGHTASIAIGNAVAEPWPAFGFGVAYDAAGKAGAIYGLIASDATPMDADRSSIYLGRSASSPKVSAYYHQLVAWAARPANTALQEKAVAYA